MQVALERCSIGGPSSVLCRKELQVLLQLTHTTEVAAFKSRVRKEKESGLMFGLEGGAGVDIMGTAA